MRQQWLVFLPMALATGGLAACASMLGSEQVKVRPVDTLSTLDSAQHDTLYESAVAAINAREYARALDYLQAAKAKDPRNLKALNALGVVYDKLGRFDLSARYYAQAQAIEPDSRIVAENQGYSRVLQRLLNPSQSVAVATIDLPPDLTKAAIPAAAISPTEKTVIATVASSAPVAPPAEKRVVDTPRTLAASFDLPKAEPLLPASLLADIDPPAAIAPPAERRIVDTPRLPMMTAALVLPKAEPLLPASVLPAVDPPAPIAPAIEKRVVDVPHAFPANLLLKLPDAKPLLAASISPLATAAAEPAMEGRMLAQAAMTMPVAPMPARFVSATLAPPPKAKLLPAALIPSLAVAEPAVERKTIVASVSPAVITPVALPTKPVVPSSPAKPVVVASASARAARPPTGIARTAAAPVAAMPSGAPAKPLAAVPAILVKRALPTATVVPMHRAAAKVAPGKVLTIGQPIRLLNASGKTAGAGPVLRRLTALGWTMRQSDSRMQMATVLFYPAQNIAAAKAMQRTLPFPVRLVADKAAGMRLVIGRDYLSWKPRNSRIAVLWQKRTVIASLQKPSVRGVR
jgi:hypothetical protein